MIFFILNNLFVLFFVKLHCSRGGRGKAVETQPKIGVNPDSRLQNAKCERKKWKHWLFAKPYNNSSFSRYPCGVMCQSTQWLARASRSSLSPWLRVATCPSIHRLLPLWIWWPLRFTEKSRCSIWLVSPQRTKCWYTAEVPVDILNCKW